MGSRGAIVLADGRQRRHRRFAFLFTVDDSACSPARTQPAIPAKPPRFPGASLVSRRNLPFASRRSRRAPFDIAFPTTLSPAPTSWQPAHPGASKAATFIRKRTNIFILGPGLLVLFFFFFEALLHTSASLHDPVPTLSRPVRTRQSPTMADARDKMYKYRQEISQVSRLVNSLETAVVDANAE